MRPQDSRPWISKAALPAAIGLVGSVIALTAAMAAPDPAPGEAAASVLGARCLSCHNSEKKTAGIDLSTRAGAVAAGISAPDDPVKNRLVRVVVAGKMPPTGKLPAEEIAALRGWVRAGLPYPREKLAPISAVDRPLWSLQPIRHPAVPHSRFDALSPNPIDRFLFAELEKKGLRPSPPASRLELLRRVTEDLTGLPPTPEEVASFLADRSPNAYEKVVDRLLASPAYGERWAQHWLDVVRYGESHGYEQNHIRPNAWPYRDYVIRAFNEDKPYDRFIQEQLAGDVVGRGDPGTEIATGFLVAGIHDTVGNQTEQGSRQQRFNDLDDIVSTTVESFMGLTVGCAKCHDHKFDPIPQRDFYRLAAVFAGVRHGERTLGAVGSGTERKVGGGLRRKDEFAPVAARFVRFTITSTTDGGEPCLDELEVYSPDGGQNLALAANGAKAMASSLLPGYAIHQIEHLNDGMLGNDHSWISKERGSGWAQIELAQPARVGRVVWSRDGTEQPRFSDRIPAAYRIETSEDGKAWKTVVDRAGQPKGEIGPGMTAYAGQFGDPEKVYLLKRGDVMQRDQEMTPGSLSRIPGFPGDLPSGGLDATAAGAAPPGESGSVRSEPERRLALARWITNPKNPLTARVIVNRIWHYHFGRGIVGTPSDFGHNGELPTHPELLDYMASLFVAPSPVPGTEGENERRSDRERASLRPAVSPSLIPGCGWSLKGLHRLIVTSYAYRQSSASNPQGAAVDAGNRMLWRMPLRRMEAESIRDAILAVSGKLDRRMGGPSFDLFRYRVVNVAIYEPLEQYGPETWRRSVYHRPARGIRDDLLGTFDCPESAQRTPRRESTTTALQALSLLNGPFMVQQAEFLTERVRGEAGEKPEAQIERAFRLAFGRAPEPDEARSAAALVRAQGLAALCRALLNANEFLYY